MLRIKPWATRWEARMLPLCFAASRMDKFLIYFRDSRPSPGTRWQERNSRSFTRINNSSSSSRSRPWPDPATRATRSRTSTRSRRSEILNRDRSVTTGTGSDTDTPAPSSARCRSSPASEASSSTKSFSTSGKTSSTVDNFSSAQILTTTLPKEKGGGTRMRAIFAFLQRT